MPKKHVLSFKHLIATSSATALGEDHDTHRSNPTGSALTVQELLDRSRAARPVRPQGLVWNQPSPAGRIDLDADGTSGDVHPAEQLRRAQVAHRQAQRSVAGPVPPPSWRSRPTPSAGPSRQPTSKQSVSDDDLIEATRLFNNQVQCHAPPRIGTPRLVDHCFRAVIRYLDSEEVVWTDEDTQSRITLGRVMRDSMPYLDHHLKNGILRGHASRISPRLSDRSIRSILAPASNETEGSVSAPATMSDGTQDDEWDDSPASELIHHLGIALHPTPHILLRSINQLPSVALTSLDLAYSTIPRNLDRLITALPTGLRELGLVGIKCTDEQGFIRLLGSLGRRLMVLRMLDLSNPTFCMDQLALEALLHPPSRQFPSLRLLGLRGNYGSREMEDVCESVRNFGLDKDTAAITTSKRKELLATIRYDRARYIHVVWD